MSWSVLQSASNEGDISSGSITVTFTTANLTAGSKIIAIVAIGDNGTGATCTGIKDGGGTSWTQLASRQYTNADGGLYFFALDTPAGDVGTKPTLTATLTGTGTLGTSILVQEVAGLFAGNTSAMLDGTTGVITGTTGSSTGSPTYSSSSANEYLVALYADYENNITTWANPSGYTGATAGPGSSGTATGRNATNAANLELAYKNSTGGSEAGSYGLTSASQFVVMLVAFKLAASDTPASSHVSLAFSSGRISWNLGGPVSNPTQGPPIPQWVRAVRAQLPQPPVGFGSVRGRTYSNPGTPVKKPSNQGPVFRQRTTPVRFTLPPPVPRAGRIGSSFGSIAQAPTHGPPVYSLHGPVRPRIPRSRTAGAILDGFNGPSLPGALNGAGFGGGMGSAGAPVRNPVPGPVFYQKTSSVQARIPLPKRGRTYSNPGGPVLNPAPPGIGPVFRQAAGPARTRPALPLRGHIAFNAGGPVKNPNPGPPFRQLSTYGPIQYQIDKIGPPRGRVYSTKLAVSSQPAPPLTGPVFRQAIQAVRARIPQRRILGSVLDGFNGAALPGALTPGTGMGSGGAPVKNPVPGPVFRQAVKAFRAQVPLHPRAGRVTGISAGGPVSNPIPPTEYLFIGHYAVEYPDYVDVSTDEMLICLPNQMYLMAVVQNRYGLTIPPPDGRWLGETEQPDEAVFVNRAERATIELALARKRNAELQARSARGERITLVEEKPDDGSG